MAMMAGALSAARSFQSGAARNRRKPGYEMLAFIGPLFYMQEAPFSSLRAQMEVLPNRCAVRI